MMRYLVEKYSYVSENDYIIVAGPDWPSYDIFTQHKNIPEFVYKEIDEMLPKKQPFTHSTFCVNPFYSMEIPNKTHCCLLPKSYDIDKIKTQMLKKIRPDECQACWTLEDANQDSDRLIKNRTLDHWADIDLEHLYNLAESGNSSVMMYKIDTSNTCNSTCVTCSSHASTSWAKLEKQNNVIPSAQWDLVVEDIDIDYANAQVIIFRGGEPLLSQTNFKILERLLEHNNTDCLISFTTNTSIRLTPRQQNILKSFANVDMCFSIDGIGSVFEYMRYPLKWQDCLDNLVWNRNNGFNISVSYTVSNLNIAYHTETVEWFNKNNLNYIFNAVYYPEYFRPSALPEQLKQQILQENPDTEIHKFLSNHTEHDQQLWKTAIKEVQKQDRWKGISINDYLPKIGKYFQ